VKRGSRPENAAAPLHPVSTLATGYEAALTVGRRC